MVGSHIHRVEPTYMVAWPASRPALVGGQVGGGMCISTFHYAPPFLNLACHQSWLAGQATMFVGSTPCMWAPHHVWVPHHVSGIRYPGIQVSRHPGIQVSRYQMSRYPDIQMSRCPGIQISRYQVSGIQTKTNQVSDTRCQVSDKRHGNPQK